MNASIYIWKRKTLINTDDRSSPPSLKKGRTVLYEMPGNRSIDIDNELDFKLVELLLKKKKKYN